MIAIYVRRINEDLMTIDDVPVRWQESISKEIEKEATAS